MAELRGFLCRCPVTACFTIIAFVPLSVHQCRSEGKMWCNTAEALKRCAAMCLVHLNHNHGSGLRL
jgi:hypothetical protein